MSHARLKTTQIEAVLSDIGADVVKVGMLYSVEMIGAVAGLALAAVDHRVVEPPDVSRRFPRPRVLDDRRVEADDRQRPAVGPDLDDAEAVRVVDGVGEDGRAVLAERTQHDVEVLGHVRGQVGGVNSQVIIFQALDAAGNILAEEQTSINQAGSEPGVLDRLRRPDAQTPLQ